MATAIPYSDALLTVIRWVARIIALLLTVVVLMFVTGEGVNVSTMGTDDIVMGAVFLIMWLGLIIAWRWEGIGGLLTTGGTMLFILMDYIFTGHVLRFWMFFAFLIPGLLFLYCWWLARHGTMDEKDGEDAVQPG
jgi:hypothetical protein